VKFHRISLSRIINSGSNSLNSGSTVYLPEVLAPVTTKKGNILVGISLSQLVQCRELGLGGLLLRVYIGIGKSLNQLCLDFKKALPDNSINMIIYLIAEFQDPKSLQLGCRWLDGKGSGSRLLEGPGFELARARRHDQ
jgi:hypothetical protein